MNLVNLARTLRRQQTSAEAKLWQELRNRNLRGFKFRRQHPIKPYIVDFYCAEVRLVVEVDGDSHVNRRVRDHQRTSNLEDRDYRVIRFRNRKIHQELQAVLQAIVDACEAY